MEYHSSKNKVMQTQNAFDLSKLLKEFNPTVIYLLNVNNRNTRTRCEISLTLTIKTTERHYWRHSGVFIINFEHILDLFLLFLLLT